MFKKKDSLLSGIKTIGLLYPPKIQTPKKTVRSAWKSFWNSFSSVGSDLQFAIKNEKIGR